MRIEVQDISHLVLGKYQYCTMARNGMWYADSDFQFGGGGGEVKKGALPSPRQDTPELCALAKRMHEMAAAKTFSDAMPKRSWWSRLFS